jgi:hypothetical protein
MARGKRHTPEPIAAILKQQEAGLTVADRLPRERDQRTDVLSLEVEVRWSWIQ